MTDPITYAIASLTDSGVLTAAGSLIDSYAVLIFALPALAAYLLRPNVRRNALRLTSFPIALAASAIIVFLLKLAYAAARPCETTPELLKLASCPLDYAFPSGHAAYAFVYAGASLGTSLFGLFFPLAIAVAASRVYMGVHAVNDVIGGIAIGLASYYVVEGLVREFLPQLVHAREKEKTEREKRPGVVPRELARDVLHAAIGTGILAAALVAGREATELLLAAALFFGMGVMHLRMRRVPLGVLDRVFDVLERPRVIPAKGAFMYALGCLIALAFLPALAQSLAVIAAFAWGDSAATTAGKWLGKYTPRWPHNRRKSLAGSLAFAVLGGIAAYAFIGPAGFALAAFCAAAETLDLAIDDNLLVPLAGVLFLLAF